jgi:ribonuclease P protein component
MDGTAPGGGRPRRRRLARSAEFERVYRHGRSKANRFLVLYAFPRPADDRRSADRRRDVADRSSDVADRSPDGAGLRSADHRRGADDGPRLGLSVSRRVGGAVERSRVKRVLREAFWAEAERLPGGSDYVVVARPEALGLAEREGTAGMRTALSELVDGLGGASAPEAA